MLPAGSWFDQLNPFHYLAGAAGKVVADGWTAAMLIPCSTVVSIAAS